MRTGRNARSWLLRVVALLAATLFASSGRATVLESWENTADSTFDGWTTNLQPYTPSYSTLGATDGTSSLQMTGTASPSYGQMLRSSFVPAWTPILGSSSALSFDITTLSGTFGGFLQFDVDLNNNELGFQSLDSFSYPATTLGTTKTITVPISPAFAATLAASPNPTQIIFQVGGGSGTGNPPQSFEIDNVRAVPEPGTLAVLGLGGLLPMLRRRR